MKGKHRYCHQCGTAYDLEETGWPKTCRECKLVVFGNPTPVVNVICPLGERVLLVKRGVEPARGSWAFAGGYVDARESPVMAAVREVREETEWIVGGTVHDPGLQIDPFALRLLWSEGVPETNLNVFFYAVVAGYDRISEWWDAMQFKMRRIHHESSFHNHEVEAIGFFDEAERSRMPLAFLAHTRALAEWERRRGR